MIFSKRTAALLLVVASVATNQAAAFSAVAPNKAQTPAAEAADNGVVDKSMKGVDMDANTFDPTTGANPALTRNNKDGVWVSQVRKKQRRIGMLSLGDDVISFSRMSYGLTTM